MHMLWISQYITIDYICYTLVQRCSKSYGKKHRSQVQARTVGIFGLSALESNPTQEARIYIMSKFTIAESMFQQEGVESLVFGDQLGHDRSFKRSSCILKFRFLRHSTDILPELCIYIYIHITYITKWFIRGLRSLGIEKHYIGMYPSNHNSPILATCYGMLVKTGAPNPGCRWKYCLIKSRSIPSIPSFRDEIHIFPWKRYTYRFFHWKI